MYKVAGKSVRSLDPILGLPPTGHISDKMKMNSMPIVEIIPCEPVFRPGLSIFTLEHAWTKYQNLLWYAGYSLESKPLKLAFLADNFPTDSFSNEYGESFLQKMTDVASEGLSAMSQFFGQRSMTGLMGEAGKFMSSQRGMLGTLGKAGVGAYNEIKALKDKAVSGGGKIGLAASRVGQVANTLLSGARVDFPSIWKNSAYAPSYTMTIRLYNPNPGDKESTKKYIIGPIAALLLLGIPLSEDNSSTYSWPFLHKVKAPGIYNLNPAFISNIAVIKGGDQQQIAFNERLGMVDVRIDFGSLYSSILATKGKVSGDRPTLKKYLKAMEEEKLHTYDSKQLSQTPAIVVDESNSDLWTMNKKEKRESNLSRLELLTNYRSRKREEKERYLARYGNTSPMLVGGETITPPSRVTAAQTDKYNGLYAGMPGGFSA